VFPGELPDHPDDLFAPGATPFHGLAAGGAEDADSASCAFARRRSKQPVTTRPRCPIFGLTVRCSF